jgi:hypothetical protein
MGGWSAGIALAMTRIVSDPTAKYGAFLAAFARLIAH